MANTVKVVHAVYGAVNDRGIPKAQDVTRALQALLEKTPNGIVTINNANLGGDPADGAGKHFGAVVKQTFDGIAKQWEAAFACREGQTIDFFHNAGFKDGRHLPFTLKLSLPGKNIRGDRLCRLEGSTLALKNYCAAYGTPRIFTWDIDPDGQTYLQDQEGNWLSWDRIYNCLYMSYKTNRAAWKIADGRLIRTSDNAVVTWRGNQRWAGGDEDILMALPPSPDALTVEQIPEPPSPMDLILEKMIAVFAKRHPSAGPDDPDRYQYSKSPAPVTAVRPGEVATDTARNVYAKGELAFFAAGGAVASEKTVPVYLLRRWSEAESRSYFKLSLQTEEAGYAIVANGTTAEPQFHAFESAQARPYLGQVYEHSAATPTTGLRRYLYDFNAEAHGEWSKGMSLFRAVTPKVGETALVGTLGSKNAMAYATAWCAEHGNAIADLLKGRTKNDVNRKLVDQFGKLFGDMQVKPKYHSLGAGAHFGYGVGTAGIEAGAMWRADEFGHVPMREPLSDYSVEWVTFGPATGVEIGASADLLAVGTWFGDVSQIEGACNGVTVTAQVFGGVSVTMTWDGSWRGANYTTHPIGVTVVIAAGIEVGGGAFYNASATQFFNRRAGFPGF